MLQFLCGILIGALLVLGILFVLVFEPWAPPAVDPFIDQFRPTQIPEELRAFLKSGEDGQGISKWETAGSLSLLLHMLFQEHKDTRALRRWVHKRLQMELNDITTRSTFGRVIQEIQVRELSLGTKFVKINSMRVENVEMSPDSNTFERIILVLDIDYTGNFETSIDVSTFLNKRGSLSVKVTKLTGLVRLILSRQPYNHWTFSFISTPVLETEISSQLQGRTLKRLLPDFIKDGIRWALQKKHVWPNYKIRYRPLFPNPLLQASPPQSSFAHVKLEGGMEVTVLQCSRLRTALVADDNRSYEVYCTVAMAQKPLMQSAYGEQTHCVSVMLSFSRVDLTTPVGITFDRSTYYAKGVRPVRVLTVEEHSLADKAAFKEGDVLVAINNVPIRSERQATKFLQQTTGDLLVLVERSLDEFDDEELKNGEVLVGDRNGGPDDAYVDVGELAPTRKFAAGGGADAAQSSAEPSPDEQRASKELSVASTSDSLRRHSVSNLESSVLDTNTDSLASSLISLDATRFEKPTNASVQRTESARVPQLLISQPSFDLRRTRSESQIDAKSIESASAIAQPTQPQQEEHSVEEQMRVVHVGGLGRAEKADEIGVQKVTFGEMDKDRTLTQSDVNNALLPSAGSIASLTSMVSSRTDRTDNGTTGTEDQDEEESNSLSRHRSSSTRRQKLQATFQAGKKRVLDLMPQKRRSTPVDIAASCDLLESIEVGADAFALDAERDRESHSRSPLPPLSKRSPAEINVVDKKPKRRWRKKNECPQQRGTSSHESPSAALAKSRSTKSVQFNRDVIWGQSLHFDLSSPDKSAMKYLNVTVHAKEVRANASSLTSTPGGPPPVATPDSAENSPTSSKSLVAGVQTDPHRPILLGSFSLYIPQVIDDCRLTLSNCHREVYQLKPPADLLTVVEPSETTSEFSRHAGFDPRLCYGDITLGFRFFPDGLPSGTALNAGEDSEEEVRATKQEALAGRPFSPPPLVPSAGHDWKVWYGRSAAATTCAMCRGKIWLRNASCCGRCLAICHNKCVAKANNGGIACSPHQLSSNDTNFEDLMTDGEAEEEPLAKVQPLAELETTPLAAHDGGEQLSKRLRLRNRVTEKFSSWRKGGKRKDDDVKRKESSDTSSTSNFPNAADGDSSPMASIQDCLSDVLPLLDGSPFISSLYFEPGNAYNEQTIKNAKVLGKQIFADLQSSERLTKINEQINMIQLAINETKDDRMNAMRSESDASPKFQGLEERLQALAVLMLHYCSALQDCQSGRNTPLRNSVEEEQPLSASTAEKMVGRLKKAWRRKFAI